MRAVIARYFLAAYLHRRDLWDGGLHAFLDGEVMDTVAERAGAGALPVLSLVIGDLLRGALTRSGASFAGFQGLYRRLSEIAYWQPLATTIEEVQKADPISPFFGWGRFGQPSPEMRFVACAFSLHRIPSPMTASSRCSSGRPSGSGISSIAMSYNAR